jgi:NAD(P)-dependent dehydrogenase (short-subunit alcohol dehydrogenase family)
MQTGLETARILVTGGSGGIGCLCVQLFAAEGAHVVCHYHRNREGAEASGAAAIVQADLRDEAQVKRMFSEAGELDACAAVSAETPERE